MRALLLSIAVFSCFTASGQYHYTITPRCDSALELVYKLRLEAANELLNRVHQEDPQNLIAVYLMDYVDFFRLYILENELQYYELTDVRNERLKKLGEGPVHSPYYRYCLAEIYLHWAINRLKFEEYMNAFLNVRKAYHLLDENQQEFPGFIYNLKSLAVLHMVIGSIPDKYKWGADLLGMQGSVEQGMGEFKRVVTHCRERGCPFDREVRMLEAFLKLHLLQQESAAWERVTEPAFMRKDDLLAHFVKASIAAHTGRNDAVISTVRSAPRGPEYIEFPFLDYLLGMALARKLDPSAAEYLHRYATGFEGRNYIKECWQKLGWLRLVEGDTVGYLQYMERVKNEGFAIVDEDKVALREARRGTPPNPVLVKARLLFDGGYYEKSLALLKGKTAAEFTTLPGQLEFTYRAGRIFQEMGALKMSTKYFYATLKNAPDEMSYYFAPNASLQLGLIFEKQGDHKRAAYFFKKAISYSDHAYENGIESQAKAGLRRLEN